MQSRQQTGVTMIELMIVIVIASILAAIAAPSFNRFVNDTRQTSTMTQLTGDLNLARSEAIKRNARVLVCVRNSGSSDCDTGTDWQNGWLVCSDADTNGSCDTSNAANPNPIRVHTALNARLTLTGSAASVAFNPNGTQGSGGAATLTLAGDWGAQDKIASIAATGNISRP